MKNKNLKYGFTLIETLVAVTILSAAMVGPMILSIKNIGIASVSQDQLVAFYLGQEVIEYVRNVRDTNLMKQAGGEDIKWLDGLTFCVSTDGSASCYIDVLKETDPVADCGVGGCPKLKFDGTNYNYTGSQETVFTRTVKINDALNGGNEARIDVAVSWTGKYGAKTMDLRDHIFNWR